MSGNEEASAKTNAWPKGIFAITLFCENLEESKEFYQRVFGLAVEFGDSDSAVFKFGDTLINLLRITEADALIEPAKVAKLSDGTRYMFTINVDDVDMMCKELLSRGVKLLNGPMDRPWGIRTASFMDPAGHIWEIAK